ncbi:hypothetical protein SAMN04489726_3561 [Allokutzneria albata]|uniref:Uncharacterized protein n=1 Tax=Allokutzneria albata TaxID=211114 RepID=A0A1G9WE70_ALLAB|nr:hypothetical protein SAMN04489726_3561 [Allokutzneria albata]
MGDPYALAEASAAQGLPCCGVQGLKHRVQHPTAGEFLQPVSGRGPALVDERAQKYRPGRQSVAQHLLSQLNRPHRTAIGVGQRAPMSINFGRSRGAGINRRRPDSRVDGLQWPDGHGVTEQYQAREQWPGAALTPSQRLHGRTVIVRGHVGVECLTTVAVVAAVRVGLVSHRPPLSRASNYRSGTDTLPWNQQHCRRFVAFRPRPGWFPQRTEPHSHRNQLSPQFPFPLVVACRRQRRSEVSRLNRGRIRRRLASPSVCSTGRVCCDGPVQ